MKPKSHSKYPRLYNLKFFKIIPLYYNAKKLKAEGVQKAKTLKALAKLGMIEIPFDKRG